MNNTLVYHIASHPLMKSLSDFAACNPNYLALIDAAVQGKKVTDLSPTHPAKQYCAFWNNLSLMDNCLLVLNNSRLVIPTLARLEILKKLHHSHSGIVKTKQLARSLSYWPTMSTEIEHMIHNCESCQLSRPSLYDHCLLYTSPSPRDRG